MKRAITATQAAVVIVVAIALVLGVGYYMTFQRGSQSYTSRPVAKSRGEMLQGLRHAQQGSGVQPQQKNPGVTQ